MTINLLHTLGSVIPFGNHFHFNLGALHAISLTYHCAERTVTREVRVACNQQVAQINAIVHIAFQWMSYGEKAPHFLNSVGYQYRLEIIAIFQTTTDTSGNSVDILQHGGVFDANYILTGFGFNKFAT